MTAVFDPKQTSAMFGVIARIHDKPAIRGILILIGLPITLLLVWLPIFGVAMNLAHPWDAKTLILSVGMLYGLLAAWTRVAVKNEYLRRSAKGFAFTASGLVFGIAIGVYITFAWDQDKSLIWVPIAITLLGGLLLAATIGAKQLPPNTIYTSAT
jgi:hypothetical protein